MYYLLIYKDIDYRIPLYIPCLGSAWIYFVILVTLQSLYTAEQEKVLQLSSNAAGKESAL